MRPNQPNLEINNQYSALVEPEASVHRLFDAIIRSGRFPIGSGDLSIAFVDDPTIARIHDAFMDDPSATDVITFPADHEMESAGEIIVSVDHARTRASELGEPFSRELSLYLIHGWLHLAGFDDRNEEDRTKMRQAEKDALNIVELSGGPIVFYLSEEAKA